MKKRLLAILLFATTIVSAQVRQDISLSEGWKFSQDKKSWRNVIIPHDWAIAGPFDKKWDLQKVAIEQNGETEATEKSGRSGALPWIGEGHYKRTLNIPEGFERAELVFDGAMAEPTVSLNGKKAGYWAYGYNAFRVDITDFVKAGDNLLEVDLKNVEESSRWYPGAGLYRPVKLILTKKTYIDDWSIIVRTVEIKDNTAIVEAEVKVVNPVKGTATLMLTAPDGEKFSIGDTRIEDDGKIYGRFTIKNPQLWSPETPNLYTFQAKVFTDNETLDTKEIKTGIRTVQVSREGGFQLNGKTRKIKGVS